MKIDLLLNFINTAQPSQSLEIFKSSLRESGQMGASIVWIVGFTILEKTLNVIVIVN